MIFLLEMASETGKAQLTYLDAGRVALRRPHGDHLVAPNRHTVNRTALKVQMNSLLITLRPVYTRISQVHDNTVLTTECGTCHQLPCT